MFLWRSSLSPIKDYINCTYQRGIFSWRYQWNARKVCLAEGICRGLKARWRVEVERPTQQTALKLVWPIREGCDGPNSFPPTPSPQWLSQGIPVFLTGPSAKDLVFLLVSFKGRCGSVPSSGHWYQFHLFSSTTHQTPCPLPTAYCFSTTVPGTSHCSFEDLGNSGRCAAVKLWGLLLSATLISLHLNSS